MAFAPSPHRRQDSRRASTRRSWLASIHGRLTAAEGRLTGAAHKTRHRADARFRALAQERLGNYEEARDLLAEAARRTPDDARIQTSLGAVMLVSNHFINKTTTDRQLFELVGLFFLADGISRAVEWGLSEAPEETLVRLWSKDPTVERMPRLALSFTGNAGMIALRGEF